jgi:hypothetical protein
MINNMISKFKTPLTGHQWNRIIKVTWAGLLSLAALGARAEEIKELKTFYFGNSYLENTMVGFHPILGKTAGKTWEVSALIHPGVPIWVHAVRQTEPESANYKQFHQEGPTIDAIVMLQFAGQGLTYVTGEMWEKKFTFDPPRDVGDIASCITIIKEYLKMNSKGRAYVYTAWPSSPELREFKKRVEEEQKRSADNPNQDRGEVMKKVKAKVEIADDAIEPILEQFDYEAAWLAKDYSVEPPAPEVRDRFGKYAGCVARNARQKDWKPTLKALGEAAGVGGEQVAQDLALVGLDIGQMGAAKDARTLLATGNNRWGNTHCRPHDYALLEGLKKEFPDMWKEGRLGMIPVGDVMLELDKKIRAGAIPPLKSVGQFAPGHMRSGLPRYMLGATFYAVLFRDHPKNLDAAIYADRANYIKDVNGLNKPAGPFYVHVPDLGRHIEITPERKKIMDDTIWEVTSKHPYTSVR